MANYYVSSVAYEAVAQWAAATVYSVGDIRRQLATPTLGEERCFRCTTGGTSGGTEPSWALTRSSTTNDNDVVWTEITGIEAYQGTSGVWAAPWPRLWVGINTNFCGNSDVFYVANDHAETQPSIMTFPSSAVESFFRSVYCVTPSANMPPLVSERTTGAQISTTGASNITFGTNSARNLISGITFTAGDGANLAHFIPGSEIQRFENCIFALGNTNASSRIESGGLNSGVGYWENCSVKFGAVGQGLVVGKNSWSWRNTTFPVLATGSAVPTNLFVGGSSSKQGRVSLSCLDFSALTNPIVKASTFAHPATLVFDKCKLPAGVVTDTPAWWESDIVLTNCDDGTDYQRHEKYSKQGTLTVEADCVRTGGPTTSWKIETSAVAGYVTWVVPFKAPPISVYNDVVGSPRTVTLYGIWDAVAVPNNDELWIECSYFGSAASPLGSWATSGVSLFGEPPAAVAADTSAWSGTVKDAMANPTAFKLVLTLTSPEAAGTIEVRVRAAKGSATFYLDPSVSLS